MPKIVSKELRAAQDRIIKALYDAGYECVEDSGVILVSRKDFYIRWFSLEMRRGKFDDDLRLLMRIGLEGDYHTDNYELIHKLESIYPDSIVNLIVDKRDIYAI